MPEVALLVSHDVPLIETVKKVAHSISHLQLEVATSFEDICTRTQGIEFGVFVLHLSAHDDPEPMARFVRSVASANRRVATLVLSDEYRNEQAVALLRAGATDYFEISPDLCKLRYFLEMVSLWAGAGRQGSKSPARVPAAPASDPFFYLLSPEMIDMMNQVRRVAPQDTTLLLTGDTGTGKTRLARLIHELSPRREEPFLVVDCGALSANLIESEIFGHFKGAFTGADCDRVGKFAAVGRGTLLLDEINALPTELQSKLLRAVDDRVYEPVGSNESRPLQARIIAAANIPLEPAVSAGQFRQDLYYRLNVVGFFLPPLRDRRGAIIPLANKFVAEFAARNNLEISGFSPEALGVLTEYDWPGNIRELRNAIERAVLLAPGPEIHTSDLPQLFPFLNGSVHESRGPANDGPPIRRMETVSIPLSQTKKEAEIRRITAALEKHRNNRLRAASELGISRMALYKKLHKYGLLDFVDAG